MMLVGLAWLIACHVLISIILLSHKCLIPLCRLGRCVQAGTLFRITLLGGSRELLHHWRGILILLRLHHEILWLVVLLRLVLPVWWHELSRLVSHPRVGRPCSVSSLVHIGLRRCLPFILHLLVLVGVVSTLNVHLLLHVLGCRGTRSWCLVLGLWATKIRVTASLGQTDLVHNVDCVRASLVGVGVSVKNICFWTCSLRRLLRLIWLLESQIVVSEFILCSILFFV
jgi:hypothetical protein